MNGSLRNNCAYLLVAAGVYSPAAIIFPAAPVQAATITPVVVEVSRKHPVTSIRFTNTGSSAITLQTQILSWHQVDGHDVRAESDDLIVSPAIVSIPAGATQLFRVTSRVSMGASEQSYRLALQDITSEVAPAAGKKPTVHFRITNNLPVFYAPAAQEAAAPSWSRCAAPIGQVCVRLDNKGNRRIRVSGARFVAGTAESPLNLMDTVLAGAWKQWTFKSVPGAVGATELRYRTEAGEATVDLSHLASR